MEFRLKKLIEQYEEDLNLYKIEYGIQSKDERIPVWFKFDTFVSPDDKKAKISFDNIVSGFMREQSKDNIIDEVDRDLVCNNIPRFNPLNPPLQDWEKLVKVDMNKEDESDKIIQDVNNAYNMAKNLRCCANCANSYRVEIPGGYYPISCWYGYKKDKAASINCNHVCKKWEGDKVVFEDRENL